MFASDAWASARRPPPLYPDAVTLRPGCLATDLLVRLDTTVGCAVKDSFGDLDLSTHGFAVLFEATWIVLNEPTLQSDPTIDWRRVSTTAALDQWVVAWDRNGAGRELFRPALLDDPRVSIVVAHQGGAIVAGAILFREAGVVGLTNYFARTDHDALGGCLATARSLEPALSLVGYERGASLTAALANGFESIGPLRVWLRET